MSQKVFLFVFSLKKPPCRVEYRQEVWKQDQPVCGGHIIDAVIDQEEELKLIKQEQGNIIIHFPTEQPTPFDQTDLDIYPGKADK